MQGVLLDRNSIVVSYDHARGEPRAKYSKQQQAGVGDCIDCKQCIRDVSVSCSKVESYEPVML